MTTTTQPREPEMGLTFEKVWAMFRESDRKMRKMKEDLDEYLRKRSEETDRQIRERSEETDRQIRETARQIREMNEETNRKMKETDKRFGDLDNRFGELAEHLVAPSIMEKFNALGFHFTDISTGRRKIITGKDKQAVAEFDILMENGESSVGVEVKSKPSGRDVKDHARRLEILRRHKNSIGDKRKIYGALAGAIMTDSVRNLALKTGLYAITQTGDTVKIDVPEGFTPKAW
ncbi:MAG: hypothetical protein LBE65_00980 [Synergistaceae bacterium]|jgi:Holliday junction resolvase-like predicted endonuclease|nr:hypothetical protein [Synergistaceae bacterium]